MRIVSTISIALLTIISLGCGGTFKPQLNFNPSEPIRIAVLPFAQVDEQGQLAQVDESLLIDNVSLVSSKLKQTPAQFVQGLTQTELSKASLDVIPPALVDAELIHAGYGVVGTNPVKMDLAKVFAADPTTLCSKVLSCDAVLYGKVTSWDRSYYGVQAVATVGVQLKLVSARTKKVLYEIDARDSDSRGITKGPTGFSNLVIEPLKGLDNEIITDLARNVIDKSIEPLSNRHRPEFLTTSAPFIIASAHDAPSGAIAKTGTLTVVAFGSAGNTASFDLGTTAQGIPMLERAPGHYIGEFVPLESDSFKDQAITVTLKDSFGRITSQRIATSTISYR
jgi:hypothetical protein